VRAASGRAQIREANLNSRPRDPKSRVPRREAQTASLLSPASPCSAGRQRRLQGFAQPSLVVDGDCVAVARNASWASGATCSHDSHARTGQNAAASPGQSARARVTELWLGEVWRRARVPQPRAGSPRGGRVMRAGVTGHRRPGRRTLICDVHQTSRRYPGTPRLGNVEARRERDPRLRAGANWPSAVCGERVSSESPASSCRRLQLLLRWVEY